MDFKVGDEFVFGYDVDRMYMTVTDVEKDMVHFIWSTEDGSRKNVYFSTTKDDVAGYKNIRKFTKLEKALK